MKDEEKTEQRVCKKCNESKPVSAYRLYKNTYLLSTCRDCEKIQARKHAQEKRHKSSELKTASVFTVQTKSGKSFEVSLDNPFVGGRRASLQDKVLYVNTDSRDSARAIFAVHYKLDSLTAIKTELVK
jgi:hypothetical protein